MQVELSPFSNAATEAEPLPAVNILVIYQDRNLAARGVRIYRNLVHSMRHDCDLHLHLWTVSALCVPDFARLVMERAREADILMLCARDPGTLPGEVKSWLDDWRATRQPKDCAFVILTDRTAPAGLEVTDWKFLGDLSRHSGITLYPQPRGAAAS